METIKEIKDMINQDRKMLDELRGGQQRVRKHEDMFNECNRKLFQMDAIIKSNEKKLREEIAMLHGHKNILKERIN